MDEHRASADAEPDPAGERTLAGRLAGQRRAGRPHRAQLGAAVVAGVVLTVVLHAWATGRPGLTAWGLPVVASPWAVVGLFLVALGGTLRGRMRTTSLAGAVLLALLALLAPSAALHLQDAVIPGVGAVASPGTATITLLAAVAGALRDRLVTISSALLVAAVSLAVLELVGSLATWTRGTSAPTILAVVCAVTSIALLPGRHRDGAPLVTRTSRWTVLASAVVPWIGMAATTDPGGARYVAAAALTTTAVLVIGRAVNLDGERTIDALFDVAPDPMLLVDATGTIVRANDQLAALTGWSLRSLVGTPVDALVPADRRGHHGSSREAFVAARATRRMGEGADIELVRADGTTTPVEIALAPVQLGGGRFVVATVRDATTHRDSMAMLLRLEEMRRLFLSAVSHELRTPLTVVKGMGDTLVKYGDRLDDRTRADVSRRLVGAAERLDTLLGDLLDLQRLERGVGLRAERVSAATIADYATNAARDNRVEDMTVEVVGAPPTVQCDAILLSRGIANLISNARKYAPGPIEVTIEECDGGTRIRVEDHGEGVPPALRGEVFEPFARGSATDSAAPGVGIGLSLVAGLASSAEGRARATGRDDGEPGASFRIWLPAAPPRDRSQAPAEPPPHPSAQTEGSEGLDGVAGDRRGRAPVG